MRRGVGSRTRVLVEGDPRMIQSASRRRRARDKGVHTGGGRQQAIESLSFSTVPRDEQRNQTTNQTINQLATKQSNNQSSNRITPVAAPWELNRHEPHSRHFVPSAVRRGGRGDSCRRRDGIADQHQTEPNRTKRFTVSPNSTDSVHPSRLNPTRPHPTRPDPSGAEPESTQRIRVVARITT